MLSFFTKKKQSPDTPPEEAIQGPEDSEQNSGDDFIFVEKKPTPEQPAPSAMYPPALPAPFGLPYPVPGGMRTVAANTNYGGSAPSYVQGVPFELAPELCTKSVFEVTQMQVDGILAMLTRQMSVDESEEYNFTLERALQNECY